MTISKNTAARARQIAKLADEHGIIIGFDMQHVSGDPRHHTTTRLRDAWAIAFPGVDLDALAEAVWA